MFVFSENLTCFVFVKRSFRASPFQPYYRRIKSANETYIHQLKVLKEELCSKSKIINTLLEIIGKIEINKRNTQPVPLINVENDLTTSLNKVTDSETDPQSDEEQQSHDNKQRISSKELSQNSKEKGKINSILVTDSLTVSKPPKP